MTLLEKKSVLWIYYLIFIMQSFNGLLKYFLSISHLIFVYYVPIGIVFSYLIISLLKDLLRTKTPKVFFVTIVVFLLATIIGLVYINSFLQVLFGNYLWLLFFFGLRTYDIFIQNIRSFVSFFSFLMLFMIFGVVLNVFLTFPWEGFSYSVGSIELQSSRAWSTYGIKRLAGFGASSYHTASIVMVYAVFILSNYKNKIILTFYWITSLGIIVLSTSKGVILAYLVFSFALFAKKYLFVWVNKFVMLLTVLVGVLLPFSVYFHPYEKILSPSLVYNVIFTSFQMRLTDAWPNVFSLVEEHGSFFFGRGIGGIGVSQTVFEPLLFCPGDNMWIYLFGIFGAIGVVMISLIYLVSLSKLKIEQNELNFLMFVFFLVTFNYGITFVPIQLSVFILLVGVFTAFLFSSTRNKKRILTYYP